MVLIADSILSEMAFEMLKGYGDESAGQWIESRPKAFHLRRRLTLEEQNRTGRECDLRGTEEGEKRFETMKQILPQQLLMMAIEELQSSEQKEK